MSDNHPLCLSDAEGAVKLALGLVADGSTCAIHVPTGLLVRHYKETVKRMAASEEIASRIHIHVDTEDSK